MCPFVHAMLAMLVLSQWSPAVEVVADKDAPTSAKRVAIERSLSAEFAKALRARGVDTSPKATALKEKKGVVMTELRAVPTLTLRVTVTDKTYSCAATAVDQRVVWTKEVAGTFDEASLEAALSRCVEHTVAAFSLR